MENVENFEITWKQGVLSLAFTDLFGNGDEYQFTPEDMADVRDGITAALNRYWDDFPSNNEDGGSTPLLTAGPEGLRA